MYIMLYSYMTVISSSEAFCDLMISVAERRLGDSLLSQMRMHLWSCYWLEQSERFCLMLRDSAASLRVAEAWGMVTVRPSGSKSSVFARCYSDFGH